MDEIDDRHRRIERIADMIDGSADEPPPANALPDHVDGPPKPKRRPPAAQRDVLVGFASEFCEFWHDANRMAYATFPVAHHREHWPLRSREFRFWLSNEYYKKIGATIGGSQLDDSLRVMEARAVNDGAQYEPFVRVGGVGNRLYLDLADDGWRAIEITAQGWSICNDPPARMLRTPAMRALPEPEAGGMIEELRQFINVRSDDDFKLVVAWLVAALRGRGPYPILVVNGEQGSGKSFFCRVVRALIDPSAAPIRAVPKDERDILVSASNSCVLAFDNLSSVPPWLSDALCRLSTGGGFATRALHTDREEMIFEATKPILLNGIPMLTDRADLADRALTVHLRTISEEERRPEDEIERIIEAARPRILAALLDAASAALRRVEDVRLPRLPRLADFAKWVTAAEPCLGWEAGSFLSAYEANRRDVSDATFEADLVAVAIHGFVTSAEFPQGWRGTPTELLAALSGRVTETVRRMRRWPISAQSMGNAFDRAAPLLRSRGYTVQRRHSGMREIVIIPPAVPHRFADDEVP